MRINDEFEINKAVLLAGTESKRFVSQNTVPSMQHVIKQKTEQSETSATAPQVRSSALPSLGLFSASL